jgi:tripartite-type tricarboxylate transporter receptor subunit TctC
LQEALGQVFVIENRAGAGGMLAAEAVAHAKPDGYTLLLTTNSTHSAAPGLFKNVPYDPIKDFTPIARLGSLPSFVGVNPDLPVKSMADLVAYAKANPGKLSAGYGNSTGQITIETMKTRLSLDIVPVAYRSNPMAITDLIAGHIQMMVPDFNTGIPQLRAGRVRALAILTKQRNSVLPDLPSLDETVMPGFDLLAWAGMFGPAGMPRDAVDTLANAIEKTLASAEVRDRFRDAGLEAFWIGPNGFADYVKVQLVNWTTLIKEAGIEPE